MSSARRFTERLAHALQLYQLQIQTKCGMSEVLEENAFQMKTEQQMRDGV